MSNIVLPRSFPNSRTSSLLFPLLYPARHTFRAASLNSAIHQGIRRSKGVGFRGKERSRTQEPAWSDGGRDGPNRRSAESSRGLDSRPQTRTFVKEEMSSLSLKGGNSLHKSRISESTFGKQRISALRGSRGTERSIRSLGKPTARPARDSDRPAFSRRDSKDHDRDTPSQDAGFHERRSNGNDKYPSLSKKLSPDDAVPRAPYAKERGPSNEKSSTPYWSQERSFGSGDNGKLTKQHGSRGRGLKYESSRRHSRQAGSEDRSFGKAPSSRFRTTKNLRDDDSPFQTQIDARIPVSIPYTTPASEFLYGTSVVEAALSSRRVPRRKHYKLYIYNGENREGASVERDAGLERLAKKNGVDVVRVSGDWLRVMDRMSGGRPHNGYILEASPLPRKPITSLGEFTSADGQSGFKIKLDHQSREEAAVNGTDDFIKCFNETPGRRPLVLLLDSIVDPGNLGGIIRTASFLGVTAIAVSTRSSASFTSVVLKASAGASENVTLFSVNKPAGFLVDSKAAGWKVYAAVAPSGRKDPDVPLSMTTDELADPLSKDPCILMLGGEGEGLRWNLRSKADVDLSIQGGGRSHNVDSLNVSVAAGILCSSFLRRSNAKTSPSPVEEAKVGEHVEPARDLF